MVQNREYSTADFSTVLRTTLLVLYFTPTALHSVSTVLYSTATAGYTATRTISEAHNLARENDSEPFLEKAEDVGEL